MSVSKCAIGRLALCAGVIAGLGFAASTMADTPVWDHMTGQPNTTWGIPSNVGTPTGSGNRQMGGAITTSDPAALTLTGVDLTFLNSTGAALVIDTTHRLRLNYWVWNTATPGAGAGNLAFSAPAGSGQIVFAPAAAINLANNTFIQFQAVAPPANTLGTAGTAPGIVFTAPITLTTNASIGIAFNWQYDNATGTFADVNGATMIIVSGGPAPALGTNNLEPIVGAGNGGYYRSVNTTTLDNNGNFNAGSARFVAANSSVAYRLYAAGAAVNVCCNLTTGACSGTASSSCPSGSTFIAATTCTTNPCPLPNACCNNLTAACTALLSGTCPAGTTLSAGVSCTPSPCGPVPNDTCAGAVTLPLSGTLIGATNAGTTADDIGGCGFNLVDGPAVWFKFVGTGNNVTISTCDASTTLDTIMHVYCGSAACTGPFNCIGGNDDDAGPCGSSAFASALTVPTISGDTYFVVINGFQGAEGNFAISALDTGTPSTDTATCASRARCVVDSDPFDFAEVDTCGAGTGLDTNTTCATATIYPALGDIAKGFLATTGAFRDIDIYKLPAAANGQSIAVSVHSEGPTLIQFLNDASGNCSTAFTVVPNSTFNLAACIGINVVVLDIPVPATGSNYFLITTPSFDGNPCGTGESSQNDYRLALSVTELGACCGATINCSVNSFNDCALIPGAETWFGSLTCTVGPNSVDPCLVTVGTCCSSAGVCSFVPSTATPTGGDCTTAGGTFTANPNGTCTPNPCAPAGVCCRGATCNSTVVSSAACTGSLISGQLAGAAFITTSSTCAAGAISSTPCCHANYNKTGGITVNDIFDFLGDWFAGSPYANTGGNGAPGPLAVQNIFDFLTNWFNGGC